MPKMKNHKAASKRYKLTATGKVMRGQAGRSHLNAKKTSKRKRNLDSYAQVSDTAMAKIVVELPYLQYIR